MIWLFSTSLELSSSVMGSRRDHSMCCSWLPCQLLQWRQTGFHCVFMPAEPLESWFFTNLTFIVRDQSTCTTQLGVCDVWEQNNEVWLQRQEISAGCWVINLVVKLITRFIACTDSFLPGTLGTKSGQQFFFFERLGWMVWLEVQLCCSFFFFFYEVEIWKLLLNVFAQWLSEHASSCCILNKGKKQKFAWKCLALW